MGKKNRTEFYKIAVRLIPVEIKDTTDKTINVIINRGGNPPVIKALPAIEHRETHEDVNGC